MIIYSEYFSPFQEDLLDAATHDPSYHLLYVHLFK